MKTRFPSESLGTRPDPPYLGMRGEPLTASSRTQTPARSSSTGARLASQGARAPQVHLDAPALAPRAARRTQVRSV